MRAIRTLHLLRRWIVVAAALLGCFFLTPATAAIPYSHAFSSGAFALPPGSKSVDWMVVNDSPTPQQIRVTVYMVLIGRPKTVLTPGPITTTVQPNTASHNANSVGSVFNIGGTYEVVVEANDDRVLPSVDVWSTNGAVIIPGTHLSPRDFTDVR